MVNAQDSTGGDTVSVPVEWAVARSGPFGLRGMNSQHSDGFAAEAWLDRLIRSYVFTARTSLSEPPSQTEPRVLFAPCRNEKDEKTWLVMAICEYDRRRLLNIRCYCVPFTEAEFGVSYREWYSRLREVGLPPADGSPIQVGLRSQKPTPPENELAASVAGLLLRGWPLSVTGAEDVPLDERLRFFDDVASLLPSGLRADLSLDSWNSSGYRGDARLFFSSEPLDAIESAQWGEPDPKFRDPDIAAYVKWLREDMPGRVTQLAALTTVQRFDAKGTRAAFDLVPRPERELAQYENFELDRAEMRHIREMRIEQHLARSALELRLAPTAELRRVLRDIFLPQDKAQRAVQAAVQRGLLVFNPPTEMRQGHGDRVEVGIARSPDLKEVLLDGLRGRGQPLFEEIRTSSVMRVELKGEAFDVTAHSAPEQVVAPTTRWEFDVVPRRAGVHTLTLCVCLFVAVAGLTETGEGLISEPVLERSVRVRVNVDYNTRRFVTANWQWLIATAVGLAGGISAWIALVH